MINDNSTPKKRIEQVFEKVVASGGKKPVAKAMREVGYAKATTNNPHKITKSKSWEKLVKKRLSDSKLTNVHKELLEARKLDHMVFPIATPDEDIRELLSGVNCVVKKIQHGEQATHVWFWSNDNKSRKEALDMAYKLKSKYPVTDRGLIAAIQINFGADREKYDH